VPSESDFLRSRQDLTSAEIGGIFKCVKNSEGVHRFRVHGSGLASAQGFKSWNTFLCYLCDLAASVPARQK